MVGSRVNSSNVNKDFLVNELGLKQLGNTTIFRKVNSFVLSPSVQNDAYWFDIRKVNLDKFNRETEKGYLLIRFFNQFLVISLNDFIDRMIDEDKFANTANSGVHWKFKVLRTSDGFKVKSMINRKEIAVIEMDKENVKNLLFENTIVTF